MMAIAVLVAALLAGSLPTGLFTPVLSCIVNLVLRYRHHVPHNAGQKPIPTAPFTWPNGQGTEKFFDGRAAAIRWREQYGPMYRIWSGFKPEIVLSKPEHLPQYYRDSHLHVKAKDNNSGWLFGELLGQCVGLVSLARWRNLRSEVDPPFTRPAAIGHTSMLIRQAREYAEGLPVPPAADGRTTTTTLVPADDLKLCPFFMVAAIFFGPLSPRQTETLAALAPLREDLFKDVFRGGVNRFKLAKYLPGSPARARLADFRARWHAFVGDAYAAAKRAGGAAPVVALWEAVEQGRVPMEELMQTLDESLYANLDVTTHAVAWNTILMAQHPAVQADVRAEMAAVREAGGDAEYERYVNADDTLLAACVVEAARVRPVLPFSNPESATDDKVIDGYIIPRGTDVVVDTHAINVANPFWEDGAKYMPRRHMGLSKQQMRYNMWRYGFGPRQCLGKNVADRLLRSILAEMVSRFDLRLPETAESQDFSLQDESWVGLPNTKVICTRLE